MSACRDVLNQDHIDDTARNRSANAGLLLASYLRVPVKTVQNEQTGQEDHPKERKALFNAAKQAQAHGKALYQNAFNRREKTLNTLTSQSEKLTIKARLIIGLGGENVLETGITLHHTYGTPIIPGSALKGLTAHYCDQVWGLADEHREFRNERKVKDANGKIIETISQGQYHHILFGSNEDCGFITFHDAWIMPDCLSGKKLGLVDDVMTPHHGDYYSVKSDDSDQLVAPSDFDDPNPVTFLAVAGTFQVFLSCESTSDDGKDWLDLAMKLLVAALENWGIGGKTNAGYGRMVRGNIPMKEKSPLNVSLNFSKEKWSKAKLTWIPGSRKLEAFGGPNRETAFVTLTQNDNSFIADVYDAKRKRLRVNTVDVEVERVGNGLKLVRILSSTETTK